MAAPLADILKVWQGLGYNRRAVALQKIAISVMKESRGRLPVNREELLKLPGIGRYTASAILTFACNQPNIFIETNIRRVFIHFFFQNRENISDEEILPLVEKTLDAGNPREWYYALMDYGASQRAVKTEQKSAITKNRPFSWLEQAAQGYH
jgi:A/G-specific adenine glycosylase